MDEVVRSLSMVILKFKQLLQVKSLKSCLSRLTKYKLQNVLKVSEASSQYAEWPISE